MIKVLLILMLKRIFYPFGNLAILIRILLGFILAYYSAILLVRVFVCTPIPAFWNGNGSCVNLEAVFIVDSFVSLITDAAILILPIALVWNLHLPFGKKVKIAGLLGAGGLATVSNIYRLWLAFHSLATKDPTFYTIHLLYTG
jgi:hypothetical protein